MPNPRVFNQKASLEIVANGLSGFLGRSLLQFIEKSGRAKDNPGIQIHEFDPRKAAFPTLKVSGKSRFLHIAARREGAPPEQIEESNIQFLNTSIKYCEQHGIEEFVFISSASVYGPGLCGPIHEGHMLNPQTPYGISKVRGEALVHQSSIPKRLCVRIPGIVELGARSNLASTLIDKLVHNEKVEVYSTGVHFNNYITPAVLCPFLIEAPVRMGFDVVNLSAAPEMPLENWLETLKTQIQSSSEIQVTPSTLSGWRLDVTKAETFYSFQPEIIGENFLSNLRAFSSP